MQSKIDTKQIKKLLSRLNTKKNLTIISLIAIFLFVFILVVSSLYIKSLKQEIVKLSPPEEQPISDLNVFKAGTIGEVKTEDVAVNTGNTTESNTQNTSENVLTANKLPPVIFSTSGIISEIKSDSLIIDSDGSSFSDNVSRNITVVFTPKTSTFTSAKDKKIGLEGLDYLSVGDKITVEAIENVRGKISFRAGIINVLKN